MASGAIWANHFLLDICPGDNSGISKIVFFANFKVTLAAIRRLERTRRQRVSQKEHTFLLGVNRRTIEVSKLVGALGNGRQLAC